MKTFRILSVLLLTLTITSCGNLYSRYSINLDCAPPCFMGITPGLTSALETSELLLSSSLVDKNSIFGTGMLKSHWYPISYSYNWEFINGERGIVWLASESKVVYIELVNPKINLSQFFELYGEPSELFVVPYWGNKTHVYLVYSELGVILDVRETLSRKNVLSLGTMDRIKTINYIDKTLLDSVIHFFIFGDVYEETPESDLALIKQNWKGFGQYTSINYWN